ncbi:MAG: SGNH/GDSL hydrolase family protein, partial [Actinomycetota bacterium]|nr:SGNH/GDSL hydrolase family protein [Actinomycetota bacterium]
VPHALRMRPDLVSIVGGGNDMLRPAVDVDVLARNLEAAVVRARAAGADVLLATGMDAKDSPVVRRTRSRVGVFNAHIWSMARRHGAFVLDVWGMRSLRDWRLWAPDRIPLNAEGHARVAQGALVALGLAVDPGWDEPLPPPRSMTPLEAARWNAEWARDWAVPWATRRLRRRSSGDAITAKRPEASPFE